MPKYMSIAAHREPWKSERFAGAKRPTLSSARHYQLIWLLACGKRVREVAEITGYCANWIRILARRYNQEGPATLADRRQHNPGASLLLSEEGQQQLQQALFERISTNGETFVKTRGLLFRLSGEVVAHHQAVKLSWKMVPANGGEVAGAGVIFLLLRNDDRIRLDSQFDHSGA